jgi:hypothetical protein
MTLTNLSICDIGIPYQGNDGVLPSLKVFWNKEEYHCAFSRTVWLRSLYGVYGWDHSYTLAKHIL